MADSLDHIHRGFLEKLKDGMIEFDICETMGISMEFIAEEEKNNAAFSNAILLINSGIMAIDINPRDLSKVLESQVDDDMAAAYFAMNTKEFLKRINTDKHLSRIYKTARKRGKAKMLVSAYDSGLKGESKMQEHFLHFHNDMKKTDDGPKVDIKLNLIETVDSAANIIAFLEQAKSIAGKSIEVSKADEKPLPMIQDEEGRYIVDTEKEIGHNADINLTQTRENNDG